MIVVHRSYYFSDCMRILTPVSFAMSNSVLFSMTPLLYLSTRLILLKLQCHGGDDCILGRGTTQTILMIGRRLYSLQPMAKITEKNICKINQPTTKRAPTSLQMKSYPPKNGLTNG